MKKIALAAAAATLALSACSYHEEPADDETVVVEATPAPAATDEATVEEAE